METNSNVMEFETLDAKVSARQFGGNNSEKSDARVQRILDFFASPAAALFLFVGKFLSNVVQGKTLAQWLSEGREITLKAVNIPDGTGKYRTFPLPEGFTLSLKTLNVWGCFACHSAHGSGIAPSKEVDYATLATNDFYYNPATRQMFVVSSTCWKQYVENRGKLANGKWAKEGTGSLGSHRFDTRFRRLSEVPAQTLDAAIALYQAPVTDAPEAPKVPASTVVATAPNGGKRK